MDVDQETVKWIFKAIILKWNEICSNTDYSISSNIKLTPTAHGICDDSSSKTIWVDFLEIFDKILKRPTSTKEKFPLSAKRKGQYYNFNEKQINK